MKWRKDDTIFPAGNVGGDCQVTEGYSVCLYPVDEPDDGLHAVITVNVYVATDTHDDDDDAPIRYYVCTQTEYMVCTDLDDLGGTEEWSDYEYDDSAYDYDTVEAADREAKRQIEAEWEGWYEWDGRKRVVV